MKEGISIAMATYNGSKYIVPQLMSILNQSLPPNELIIVDDASSDRTVEIINGLIKDYPIIKLYINEKNLGPIASFKKSVSICIFDYIALADQDDIWEENKLEICLKQLKKIEDINKPSIVFTDLKIINFQDEPVSPSFWEVQGYNIEKTQFKHVLIGNIITGCTIMMNRRMKTEVANMPDSVTMHDHWIATIAYGIGKLMPITESPIRYRVHQHSVTNKSKITLCQRISLFYNSIIDGNRLYIRDNIIQAEYFYELYRDELSADKKKTLLNFIALKTKSSLYRKLYVGYIKFLSN